MKHTILSISFCVLLLSAATQSLPGSWVGRLTAGGSSLRFVMHLQQENGKWTTKFDSPDQNASGIPGGETRVDGDSIITSIPALGAVYRGKWDQKDAIAGTFSQGGMAIALPLERTTQNTPAPQPAAKKRPQTPVPPFPYISEDVVFDDNTRSMHFGGTLTKPANVAKPPALIIISGSGTQDRDGTLFEHKLYAVLADHLSRNGFAVLRVDDRGAGKSSRGDIANITSEGLSYDVEAALNYLLTRSDIDPQKIGLIGHSEGGIIAPMLAARRKDIACIVLWGAPTIGGKEINTLQNVYSLQKAGIDTTAVAAFSDLHTKALSLFAATPKAELDTQILKVFTEWKQQQPATILQALGVSGNHIVGMDVLSLYHSLYDLPWMRYFITYNPVTDLQKVSCPVLAINGTKDTQVDAGKNLGLIKEILERSGNKKYTVTPLPGLNHLLQTAVTGDDAEYGQIEETIAPAALTLISDWLSRFLLN